MMLNDNQIKTDEAIKQLILRLKEQKKGMSADLAREVAEQMKETSQFNLSMETINLYCSLFEGEQMSEPENREAGKILLKPLHEEGFDFVRDRCFGGYIQNIRDDKNALLDIEGMLQEDIHYLEYITRLKETSAVEIRKGYLEDENMRFITTNIIDIDGTLDYGREISGKPKLNQNIIHMIVEHPEDDFAICTRRIFTSKERMETCETLIKSCNTFLEHEPENMDVLKFIELLKNGKLKAYSKRDLMNNEHVCLAGSITDDEMPEILGIQSLTDASVSVYRSDGVIDEALMPLWKAIPAERKMTLQEFEDEKMRTKRMQYLQNPDMKFITTELIDFKELLTPEKELDINKVKLLLNKQDDWALVVGYAEKVMKESDDETICRFKKVIEEQDKIIDRKLINRKNDICLIKPFVHPQNIYKIQNLTDDSISIFSEPVPMDSRIKQAYEQIPAARKMTIKEYLNMEQKIAEKDNSAVQEAMERVETQKQR
ncbi:hypothetical protein IJ556_02300, partial [bacterium]|nr:hypothetical protein [bacterium]